MTTGGADRIFVDTNILVYANVASAPRHQPALDAIEARMRADTVLWTSRQVLREYLATLSRPQTFTGALPVERLVERVRYFESHLRIAEDSAAVTARLLELLALYPTGGRQVHDANIVATMIARGVPALLTANPADFARFAGLITVLPLEARP